MTETATRSYNAAADGLSISFVNAQQSAPNSISWARDSYSVLVPLRAAGSVTLEVDTYDNACNLNGPTCAPQRL